MKNITKALVAAVAAVGGLLQIPAVQTIVGGAIGPFIANHPNLAGLVGSVVAILAVAHNPKA